MSYPASEVGPVSVYPPEALVRLAKREAPAEGMSFGALTRLALMKYLLDRETLDEERPRP